MVIPNRFWRRGFKKELLSEDDLIDKWCLLNVALMVVVKTAIVEMLFLWGPFRAYVEAPVGRQLS